MSSLFKIFTNEYEQQKPDVSISLSTKKGPVEDRQMSSLQAAILSWVDKETLELHIIPSRHLKMRYWMTKE